MVSDESRAEIVELYRSGLFQQQVAERVGVSRPTVRTVLRRAGVQVRPCGRQGVSDERRAEIVELYRSGLTQQETATLVGVSMSTVSRKLKSFGVQVRPRGEHPISDERRAEIVELYRSGLARQEATGRG